MAMIVGDIERVVLPDGCELSARVSVPGTSRPPKRLFYRFGGIDPDAVGTEADPFLAATLLPAMIRGEELQIAGRVSERLLDHTSTLMDIYHAWEPDARPVRVTVDGTQSAPRGGKEVGLFFSCGVDSFHVLLKNMMLPPGGGQVVSRLLLVHGFDIRRSNETLFAKTVERAHLVANAVGKSLVTVETNLREFSDPMIERDFYHGAGLASVALALGGMLKKCVIAGSHAYQDLGPRGSHPMLPPLWSTESTELTQDGGEARRSEKIAAIGQSPLALANLRVCWMAGSTEYNCGECEKCLRTMIALHAAGVLDRCTTFARPLDVKRVRRMHLDRGAQNVCYLEDLIASLGSSRENRALRAALRSVIRRTRVHTTLGPLARRQAERSRVVAALLPIGRRAIEWAWR
jgi:hypothetical protein